MTASKRNVSAPPFAFTREGIAMLSGVLKSDIAIEANIRIMRAFVRMNEYLLTTTTLSAELTELKARVNLLQHQQEENLGAINDFAQASHRIQTGSRRERNGLERIHPWARYWLVGRSTHPPPAKIF